MVHKACRPGLKSVRNAAIVITADRDIPPKLPDTTNLVFTRSKNEYREMMAMTESVIEENRSPPLKKLEGTINQRTKVCTASDLRFPQKQNPGPNE